MNFFETWIEADLNPIITFSNSSKILYSNNEAQFLLNRVSKKELFDLAINNAPMSYGIETKYVNITLASYTFYAITVYYEDEESISLKLYKSIIAKNEAKVNINQGQVTNIFTLIDLAISTQKVKKDILYIKSYDPSIPEFKLSVNNFLKLLNESFEAFSEPTKVTTTVKLKTGEYIKIEGKKYSLITILIESDGHFHKNKQDLNRLASASHSVITIEEGKISIDLPLFLA